MNEYVSLVKEVLSEMKIPTKVKRKLKLKATDPDAKFKKVKYKIGDSWEGGMSGEVINHTIHGISKDGRSFYIAHDQSGNSMGITSIDEMWLEVRRNIREAEQTKIWQKEQKQNEKEEAQRLIDRVSLHGYEKELSKLQLGKVAKALEEKITVKGKTWLMRDWVYDMIMNQKATVDGNGFVVDGMRYKMKSKIPLNYGKHLELEYEEQLNPSDNWASDDDMASLFGK